MGLYWSQKLSITLLTASIVALFFIPAYKFWDNSKLSIDNLTTVESTVQDIGLRDSNSISEIVYFRLNDLDKTFGIQYTDKPTRELYLDKIHVGDKVRVTFNASGPETEEGLNLHIYELEHNGQSLIKKKQVDNRKRMFSKIMFGLGTVFLICPFLLYRYAIKKNIRERTVKAKLPPT